VLGVRDDRFARARPPATGKQLLDHTDFAAGTHAEEARSEPTRSPSCARTARSRSCQEGRRPRWRKHAAAGNLVLATATTRHAGELDAALDSRCSSFETAFRSKIHLRGLETGGRSRRERARRRHLLFETIPAIDSSSRSEFRQGSRDRRTSLQGIGPWFSGGRIMSVRKDGSLAAIDLAKAGKFWRSGALPAHRSLAVGETIWHGSAGNNRRDDGVEIASGEVPLRLGDGERMLAGWAKESPPDRTAPPSCGKASARGRSSLARNA